MWGSVRECGEVGGECGKVWRDVSGECEGVRQRRWVSVGRRKRCRVSVEGVERSVEKCVGSSTLFHTSTHFSSTSPQPPHSPRTLLHISPHTFPKGLYFPTSPIPTPHPNTLPHSFTTFFHSFHIPPILNPFS